MNIAGPGPSLANAVTPFAPVGRQAVGLENAEAKAAAVAPVEEAAESAGALNRRSPEQQLESLRSEGDVIEALSSSDDIIEALASDAEDVIDALSFGGSAADEPAAINGSGEPEGNPAAAPASAGERGRESRASGDNTGADRAENRAEQRAERREQIQIQQEIRRLAARDREVRAHEAAHAAVGGQFAGAPSYQYERGPDGVSYAVAGEVPISLPQNPNNPQQTLQNAEQVRRAALAPAEPSAADRRIAARAVQVAQQARAEIAAQQAAERAQARAEREAAAEERDARLQAEEQARGAGDEEAADTESEERAEQNNGRPDLPPLASDFSQRLLGLQNASRNIAVGSVIDQRA